MSNNFERMIAVVNEVFDTRHNPDQISVTEEEREKLQALHPATMNELADESGPIVWILLIPTTSEIMRMFLNREITEKELLEKTQVGISYDVVYLCSASVLPEYRGKGLAKKVTVDAVRLILEQHPIKYLFYWAFTPEGAYLAQATARELNLELKLLEH
jgi:GNAT superfamily N-acetyltransferase